MSCKVNNLKNIHLEGLKAVLLHQEISVAAQELAEKNNPGK